MKIRVKFIFSILSIIITFGVILNLSIRHILIIRMEASIGSSLNEIMYSTREAIKYRLLATDLEYEEDSLVKESNYLNRYISSNFQCTVEIRDTEGKILSENVDESFRNTLDSGNKNAEEGVAVVNLKYEDKKLYGILSYPIFINEDNLGVLSIIKDYSEAYDENNRMMLFITVVEGGILFFIFGLSFFIITKVTKPIITLTEGVKKVGQGDYSFYVDVYGNDEIAILSREFNSMKEKIEEQINTIKEEKQKVEKLEKSRKAFFDNVTHEMKTPLTAISGYAEMINDEMVKDEAFKKRAIERIYLESERLHHLIIKLIEISKGLSYTAEEFKEISIDQIIDEISEDMSIKAQKYSIKIINNLESGIVSVQCNRIRELIINLIDNGIKYSKPQESLYINGKIEGKKYILEVKSMSGIIPKEIYDHIFEPFIKSKKFSESESRGLGLYLCSEIIKDHGGSIDIINGEKVTVKVNIPLSIK
ncbi:ATP-binding protein [Clostridium sp.]|uniref:sensor histidine kinase n=1 Tax=Clostridium sp. TaxID=1506 RepID=UPI003464986F